MAHIARAHAGPIRGGTTVKTFDQACGQKLLDQLGMLAEGMSPQRGSMNRIHFTHHRRQFGVGDGL